MASICEGRARNSALRVRSRVAAIALCGAVLCLPLTACSRITGLPEVPASVSMREAGLDMLPRMVEEASRLGPSPAKGGRASPVLAAPDQDPVSRAGFAFGQIEKGRGTEGLRLLAGTLDQRASDLVIGNAYRMAVYRLQREALAEGKARGERMPPLPEFLRGEPLATLEHVAAHAPGREIRLQIAMAHVDTMVLNPALEIRAPASIDSVRVLTEILKTDPYYVPALVARGLNFLYRPRRLVWPEHPAPPPDAASRDLSLAAAVGAKVGGAPPRLKGLLLMLLGDACAHEGRVPLARSWWALARETSGGDAWVGEEIAARMTWPDAEVLDRLEDRLEQRMADMENPVSDLSFLWGAGKGPS